MPKFFYGTRSLSGFSRGTVLTIGAFDGVHLGHGGIVRSLQDKSVEHGLPAVAVTFYPDPAQYFRPQQAPPQIMSLREKTGALLGSGVDAVVCLPFNEETRCMTAADFVRRLLVEKLGAKYVIVGDDFRFGAGREGDFELLRQLGSELGFVAERAETHEYGGERVSSTRLRKLLQQGELEEAEHLLGRPFEICGRVVRGHQLGRDLGFPTANIPLRRQSVPLSGIFAVHVQSGDEWYEGAANLGCRPAVNSLDKPLLEVHLLDFDDDLYGQHLKVRFVKKLREEKDFGDLEALRVAIQGDVDQAKAWFLENPKLPELEVKIENR